MKIEICEQMLQSWLLNCRLCEVVQTNWMISPLRPFSKSEIDDIEYLMRNIQNELNNLLDNDSINALQKSADDDSVEEYDIEIENNEQKTNIKRITKVKKLNIFKKNKPEQFIRQCEIDVVGTKFQDGVAEKIYLVDTAFHKGGLGYHDAVATVLKKIIRAILVSAIVFGTNVPISIIFAAPKCGHKLTAQITSVVQKLKTITARDYPNITIDLYLNQDFTDEVYLPLKKEIDQLNNDNDLFMRALNLASVSESFGVPVSTAIKPASPSVPLPGTVKHKNIDIVFDVLTDLIKSGKMTTALLNDLQKPAYASLNFKIPTYPILLKESNFGYFSFERCRFYKQTITVNKEKYLVCSQWIPERIVLLQNWHKTV